MRVSRTASFVKFDSVPDKESDGILQDNLFSHIHCGIMNNYWSAFQSPIVIHNVNDDVSVVIDFDAEMDPQKEDNSGLI